MCTNVHVVAPLAHITGEPPEPVLLASSIGALLVSCHWPCMGSVKLARQV